MKRFRDYGFKPGMLPTGKLNKITDVRGVKVGHSTRIEGEAIRTGVTLIDPGIKNLYFNKVPAAIAVGNGFGKMTGSSQIDELGTLETPIALTNTLSVGAVMNGLVELVLKINENLEPNSTFNAVVGETSDGIINDMHRLVLGSADVDMAYKNRKKDFDIGCVGAGTGTCAFAWKGGIGSASRIVCVNKKKYTVGALLQTNFGGALTIMGVPIGIMLGKTSFDRFLSPQGDGSCMMIIATDAPLSSRQLGRMARRAALGLARTGSVMAHGSGDYAIVFSTDRSGVEGKDFGACISDRNLTPFFLAVVETVEESVYDSMFAAKTLAGRSGNKLEQLPIEKVLKILKKHLPAKAASARSSR
ncbi:MAG TPA: P1 family peptidase [Candidatus Sumerlaeota bacterium]|nr:P1 family peptidase [Candidatus Sumerlaeota bacterium]HON50178.1 P1 family peptidase [Candidatus Sumerlaeota bacterium]HOR63394.1 P1 family peptidase [Candidatus Sumerlaeota bacterium]HPL74145.1 P1 family peptidase [Candidatus Sumerlaeota bacterium]HRU53713.1 P1 family peptidase [Candidatus Sumerlaeia bacterium]